MIPFEKQLSGYNYKPTKDQVGLPDYYHFAGWYTTVGCLDGTEFDLDSRTMPAENLKLYAKFVTGEAIVAFDSEGGSDVASKSVKKGNTISQPEDPTKDGFRFMGWFENLSDNNSFDFGKPITGDVTLQ